MDFLLPIILIIILIVAWFYFKGKNYNKQYDWLLQLIGFGVTVLVICLMLGYFLEKINTLM